jgi:hypothetical protein
MNRTARVLAGWVLVALLTAAALGCSEGTSLTILNRTSVSSENTNGNVANNSD